MRESKNAHYSKKSYVNSLIVIRIITILPKRRVSLICITPTSPNLSRITESPRVSNLSRISRTLRHQLFK